jgi:soluble lytic murein transglycosylase-like protein
MQFTRTRQMDSRRMERLRGETSTLLRSRAVQSMLITTAVLQTISVVGDKHQQAPAKETSVKTTALAQPLAPVRAQYIRRAEAEIKAAVAPEAEKPSEDEIDATELAAEYRAKGYKVPDTLAEQIVEAATESGIEPDVAFGLVATESGFQRKARSHVGAIGLAQLMPATARWLEPGTTRKDLENPETNLRLGLRYLSSLIEKYDGNTELALTAYNRGPGTVDRVLRRGGDPDNGYAGKVLGSE